MDFTEVILQIGVLFIIMFLGLFLRHKNIITEGYIKGFTALIFYVTMPAMILSSISKTKTSGSIQLLDVIIAAAISYTFLLIVAYVMPKVVRAREGSVGLYRFMALFGNVGFIGFPMIIAILGDEYLFTAALFNIPYNLFLYTFGVYFIMSDQDKNHKLEITPKQFLNPGIIMTLIGLVVFFSGIKLPSVINDVATSLGNVTTPLAMIVVGASLYGVKVTNIFKNYRVMAYSLLRMMIFPLVIGFILSLIGIDPFVSAVAIVLIGMPIATNTVIIARQYGGNVLEASEAVFISTIFMILTTPVLVMLVNLFT